MKFERILFPTASRKIVARPLNMLRALQVLLAAIVASVLLQIRTVTIPGVRDVFGVDELPMWAWSVIFVLALALVTIIEVAKLIRAGLLMRSSANGRIMPVA